MLTKDKVLSLRDLALYHLPQILMQSKDARANHGSMVALRVVAGAPDKVLYDVTATAIERRAAILLTLVQQHPHGLVEWLNEQVGDDDFPGALNEIAQKDALANQEQTESLMLDAAKVLCDFSGTPIPPWMTVAEIKTAEQPAPALTVHDKPTAPALVESTEKKQSIRKGATKQEILTNSWPIPLTINLSNLLSDVPKWLEQARLSRGAPGKESSRWNPAMLAVCLATEKAISKLALTRYISMYFAEWADEWERLSDSI